VVALLATLHVVVLNPNDLAFAMTYTMSLRGLAVMVGGTPLVTLLRGAVLPGVAGSPGSRRAAVGRARGLGRGARPHAPLRGLTWTFRPRPAAGARTPVPAGDRGPWPPVACVPSGTRRGLPAPDACATFTSGRWPFSRSRWPCFRKTLFPSSCAGPFDWPFMPRSTLPSRAGWSGACSGARVT
jgi:hypothetical protein